MQMGSTSRPTPPARMLEETGQDGQPRGRDEAGEWQGTAQCETEAGKGEIEAGRDRGERLAGDDTVIQGGEGRVFEGGEVRDRGRSERAVSLKSESALSRMGNNTSSSASPASCITLCI